MGMNDEEIWQSDHKGHKGESCYRVGYGEVNDLGGEDKTLFKLHENFCPPVQVVLHHRVCHHTKPDCESTWRLALLICQLRHSHSS